MKKTFIWLGALLLILNGCANIKKHSGHGFYDANKRLVEKDAVKSTVEKLFISTDNRDWPAVKDVFADSVLFDMTSLAGGKPTTLSSQDIVDAWDKGLKALKAIHHQTGNYRISIHDNEADVFCYGIAFHYLPNKTNRNTRTFVGSYDFHLTKTNGRWKIDQFKFNLKFIDGNLKLESS